MVKNYEKQIQLSIKKYEKLVDTEEIVVSTHQKKLKEYQSKLNEWKKLETSFIKIQDDINALMIPEVTKETKTNDEQKGEILNQSEQQLSMQYDNESSNEQEQDE